MEHFVLTRFNIASPGRETPIRNSPGWLERRFELFEAYCLPSMAAQDDPSFRWLIYFDEKTPPQFVERIEAARRIAPFDPILVGTFVAKRAQDDISARLSAGEPRLLTTRLDNDDAVSRDFLSRLREQARALPDGTILNFPEGIALRNGKLYTARDESNPFTSLVEAAAGAKTIWAAPHTELAAEFPIVQIESPACWLQVVHGENVTNRIKGRRMRDQQVMARFELDQGVDLTPTSTVAVFVDRLLLFPLRQSREWLIKLAKLALRR